MTKGDGCHMMTKLVCHCKDLHSFSRLGVFQLVRLSQGSGHPVYTSAALSFHQWLRQYSEM